MDTLNYKCPNCSAGLTFDSKEQKMKCEFCGSTYSLEELDKLAEAIYEEVRPGDMVITMGAGSITRVGQKLTGLIKEKGLKKKRIGAYKVHHKT